MIYVATNADNTCAAGSFDKNLEDIGMRYVMVYPTGIEPVTLSLEG